MFRLEGRALKRDLFVCLWFALPLFFFFLDDCAKFGDCDETLGEAS